MNYIKVVEAPPSSRGETQEEPKIMSKLSPRAFNRPEPLKSPKYGI